MATYTVYWSETWTRHLDYCIDEVALRDWAEVPIGPISWHALVDYLEESIHGDGYEEWIPASAPGTIPGDECSQADVEGIFAPGLQ